jgi:Ran GTPase-activating protein (RanGAP) involved in mRNA processing and transport
MAAAAAAAMALVPGEPDPRWKELLAAAQARPYDAAAWEAFGRCFQGCTEINLSGKRLHDACATALAQHAAQHWPNLQSLVLSDNSIGAAGATALAAQHLPNLQSLYLVSNSIGDAGATALAQQAAQHWPNLQDLYLCGNLMPGANAAKAALRRWARSKGVSLTL